jgi:opacity protein-like surface antigen
MKGVIMKSKVFIYTICLFLSAIVALHSQSQVSSDSTKGNSLYPGSWSMQFRIQSYFTLSSFKTGNISLKKHISDKNAIRLGVSLSTANLDGDDSRFSETNEVIYKEENSDNYDDSFNFGLNLDYIFYPNVNRSVLLYLGAGPTFKYNYSKSKDNRDYTYIDTLRYIEDATSTRTEYNLGLTLIGGVEIFILDYLSLHAEYNSSFYYTKYDRKSNRYRNYMEPDSDYLKEESVYKDDGYRFSANSVLFGISLYF